VTWSWIRRDVLISIHKEQISEHGGADGIRDEGLFDSALARPENLVAYGDPDPFELAALYAAGIVKNHPFIDGNKRTGFIAGAIFLELNGYILSASNAEVVEITLSLAAGEVNEEEFAFWLKENSKPV
jgi:death on curing protein